MSEKSKYKKCRKRDVGANEFYNASRLFPVSKEQLDKDWNHYLTQIFIRKEKWRKRRSLKIT